MSRLILFVGAVFLSMLLQSCHKEDKDRVKVMEMTIFPETKYSKNVLSDVWTDVLVISDSEYNEKQNLNGTITEGFNFDEYERGYQYIYKVKKVWMREPPQDVSSVKYIYLDQLSKKKMMTENSEKNIQLFVLPERVEYSPSFYSEFVEKPILHYALLVKDMNSDEWMALIDIDGFDFEKGYEYILNAKEFTQASPYSRSYTLLDVISKKESKKIWPGVEYNHSY
ncbi:MAG: DUF4377 domain-containing protein [Candidatus Saccharimonadaceae bacterium]